MNIISISGNTTKDMEIRHLPDGKMVGSFSVADNMGKDKGAIFWNCSWFSQRAESIQPYMPKGTPVTVNGTVSEREFTDKNGQQRKSMDVRVNDVALQGGKRDQGDQGAAPPRPATPTRQSAPPQSGFNGMDDDIPFATSSMLYDMTTSKQRKMARYDY